MEAEPVKDAQEAAASMEAARLAAAVAAEAAFPSAPSAEPFPASMDSFIRALLASPQLAESIALAVERSLGAGRYVIFHLHSAMFPN